MAGEDKARTAWIRTLPCCSCGRRPVEVHHRTGAGMALRAHDHEAMPLCHNCHMDLHSLSGPFKGWDKTKLRAWQREQIDKLGEPDFCVPY